ncbi:BTAD domain-containing putative transcriptional regulator [Oricola cellulosilytica]|nr:BTAD domain-containing putative transcriptional regulator [Oricola cellulosilytica]
MVDMTPEGVSAPKRRLKLALARGFQLTDTEGNRIVLPSRKAQAMVAYLVLSGTFTESRERLAHLLWSASDPDHARSSLRQCLKQLKKAFEDHGLDPLDVDRSDVRLHEDAFDTDVISAERQLGVGEICAPLRSGQIQPDNILEGFDDLDEEFQIWLSVSRQRYRTQISKALEGMVRNSGGEPLAEAAAEALLAIDPSHEEAHRAVIESYARKGNTAAAIRQYTELWDHLAAEYDMEPSEETLALIARVKMGSFEPVSSENGRPKKKTKTATVEDSLALPVISVNFSMPREGDQLDHFVAFGFRSELITCLSKIREWVVVEADSTDQAVDGHGPDYRLEASFVNHGNDVAISIRLVGTLRGRMLWSEMYSFSVDDWGKRLNDITRRIAATLDVYISADALRRGVGSHDYVQRPYMTWLKAQHLMGFWQPKSEFEAEKLIEQVIEEWPAFSPPYSSLANIYNSRHIVLPGLMRDEAIHEKSLDLVRKAVELDPLDARSHLTATWCNMMLRRFARAEIHLDLCQQLDPSSPSLLMSAAQAAAFMDRHETAERLVGKATLLTPFLPQPHWSYLVGIRFMAGDYEGCVMAAGRASPSISNLPGWKAAAEGLLGMTDEARQTARLFVRDTQRLWSVDVDPTEERIMQWFLQCFPIRNRDTWLRLRSGLQAAGLPVGDEILWQPEI